AAPSVTAFSAPLSMRSASGDFSSSSRAQLTVSSSSLSTGTTALTRPISSASGALYWRHRYQISLAFLRPTVAASSHEPYPPSNEPTLGPVCPNTALSAATVRSQHTCSTWPPPIAYPATMAITGLGVRRICTWRSSTLSRPTPRASRYPSSPRIFWSPPEQNASVPAPVKMITPMPGSSRATLNACEISHSVVRPPAFRTLVWLMVIFATPSAVSSTMSVSSCAARCPSVTPDPPIQPEFLPVTLTFMAGRSLHALLLPPAAGAGRLLDALAAALDGSGPAILPLDPDLPPARVADLLHAFTPATIETLDGE